jgi:hypothetical protein
MHQNNVFFKKIIFDINTSKRSENIKKKLRKKLNFGQPPFGPQSQMGSVIGLISH